MGAENDYWWDASSDVFSPVHHFSDLFFFFSALLWCGVSLGIELRFRLQLELVLERSHLVVDVLEKGFDGVV